MSGYDVVYYDELESIDKKAWREIIEKSVKALEASLNQDPNRPFTVTDTIQQSLHEEFMRVLKGRDIEERKDDCL